MVCFEENTALAFAQAKLAPETLEDVEAHARSCADCHQVLLGALGISGVAGTVATVRLGPTPVPHAPAPVTLTKGTSVGRYTVLALVGRGGMGDVYLAHDPSLDRRVALKLMRADGTARDERAQERLLREAQAIAKLSHPNVVVVHDVGTFGDQVFVAMEFVEGQTLAAWLGERPRKWREILGVFLQAARGLSAAHHAGLVHRDFKPQNVMVGLDGTARVMDFGLARRIGADRPERVVDGATMGSGDERRAEPPLTRTGERMGTPMYMAPEQFSDGETDARTDQFSFCVALHCAIYGTHPFGGSTIAELATNVSSGRLRLSSVKSDVPPRLLRILARGLSLHRGARWPSMDELAATLGRLTSRRTRAMALLVGAGVVCAAIGGLATHSVVKNPPVCMGGQERFAGIWEVEDGTAGASRGSRRAEVHDAILKSGVQNGMKIWNRVAAEVDTYAANWIGAYHEACQATHIRHEQSEEALDLRMACLNDNLDSARAFTKLLAQGEREVVAHAVDAAGSLGDLSRCADVAQLRNGVQPPKDPMIRDKVAELRRRLKDAEALFEVASLEKAASLARAVLSDAQGVGYCPVEAEALALLGNSVYSSEGTQLLERALVAAESCRHDRVVARAAVSLVFPRGSSDWSTTQRRAAFAFAAIDRIGGDRRLKSWLLNDLGVATMQYGRPDDAQKLFVDAIGLKEQLLGSTHIDVAISLNNLALILHLRGMSREALTTLDRAIAMKAEWVGEVSESLAPSFSNRGEIFLDLGRFEDAAADFETARNLIRGNGREPPIFKAILLQNFGRLALQRGDVRKAIEDLQEAHDLHQTLEDLPSNIAENNYYLGVALGRAYPHDPRALGLVRQALAYYEIAPSFERQRREAREWIDARSRRRKQT